MDRASRVRRLKRIIVISLICMILIPIVLCIILGVRVSKLESDNAILQENVISLETDSKMLRSKLESYITEQDRINENVNKQLCNDDSEEVIAEAEPEDLWPHKVYLTFDDGPSGHTMDILNILDRYQVKGNFFVCATRNEEYQTYYNEILSRGHMLGIHSYSHIYNEVYHSEESFEKDVTKIRNFVSERTDGYVPVYYRFPGGSTNIGSRVNLQTCSNWLSEQGLTYFDWNISSNDATNPMQPVEVIIENATNGCEKYEEVMILMHDLGNKDSTIEALPSIIEFYLDRGAVIDVIDKDTMLIQHE